MRGSVRHGGLGLAGIVLVLAGLAVLSARTDGPISWHITSGSSMRPSIEPGTLVVVARQPSYAAGDVVAYRSAELRGQVVLHRVVGIEDSRLLLQGDSNSWVDAERPLPSEALGSPVLQLGGVGGVLGWLRQPAALGMAAALLALPFVGAGRRSRRGRRDAVSARVRGLRRSGPGRVPDEPTDRAAPRWQLPAAGPTWTPDDVADDLLADPAPLGAVAAPPAEDVVGRWAAVQAAGARLHGVRAPAAVETGVAATAALCLLLAAVATVGPLVRTETTERSAEHLLSWSYGERVAPGIVYADGLVETGDTLYTRLVSTVDVTAQLDVEAPADARVSGTWRLDVSVEDDNGWRRTAVAGTPAPVTGRSQRLSVDVPVAELLDLSRRAAEESGVEAGRRLISVQASVDLLVESDGAVHEARLTPMLAFLADDSKVRLVDGSLVEQRGAVALTSPWRTRTVHLAGLAVPAGPLRIAGLAGAVLALAGLGVLRAARRSEKEDERITRTAGHLLVPMDDLHEPALTVDVSSFEALAAIAASYDRRVLFGDHDGLRVYLVLDDGVAYRYYSTAAAAQLEATAASCPEAATAVPALAGGPPVDDRPHRGPAPSVPQQRTAGRQSARS